MDSYGLYIFIGTFFIFYMIVMILMIYCKIKEGKSHERDTEENDRDTEEISRRES